MAEETNTTASTIADVKPTDFVLRDFIEEIAVLIQERQAFLDSKLQRKTIGAPEADLARFRLIRMGALHHYLLRIEAHQSGREVPETLPAPKIESPLEDFRQEIAAEIAAEEKPEPVVETLPPEPETVAPEAAPAEEPVSDWDD